MIIPSAGYLLVRILQPGKQTSGGLYLPDDQKEEPMTAIVVAIGRSCVKDGTLLAAPVFDIVKKDGTLARRNLHTGDTIFYKRRTHHELGEQMEVEERHALLPFESVL